MWLAECQVQSGRRPAAVESLLCLRLSLSSDSQVNRYGRNGENIHHLVVQDNENPSKDLIATLQEEDGASQLLLRCSVLSSHT